MKPIYTILLSITIGLTFSSCEVMSYLAESYTNYVEESGNDPLKIKRHATAWQQGSTSQGLVIIDAGIAAIGAVTGEDVSNIRNITDSVIGSLALHPHAGESEKINLISGLLYTADRVINHFEDKSFEERVAALSEECAKYSDPDHPRYNPYCMEWYDIDYDNRRITQRDSKDAINSIRQIERENYLNQTYPELVKYGLVYDEEIMSERNGKYVGTGKYQLQKDFVRLMKQSRDDVLKKGGDIAKYDEYQQLMYKLRSIKTQEYYSSSNSTYKSSTDDTEYSTLEVADNITIEEQHTLPTEKLTTFNQNSVSLLDTVSGQVYQNSICSLDTINGHTYYRYRVPRGIGIYRIGVNFGISQEYIMHANPKLQYRALQCNEVILVPAENSEMEVVIDQYKLDAVKLTLEQKKKLDAIAATLLNNKEYIVSIIGHTCDIGSKRANKNISAKRALAAKEYLIQKGIVSTRIKTLSAGATLPLVPNDDEKSRKMNRRISFIITTL